MEQRAGASGPFVLPATVKRLNWDALANLALTVLPAGHPPGNYEVVPSVTVVEESPSGGLATLEVRWSDAGAPQVLAYTAPTSIAFAAKGPQSNYPISLHSDGTAAIVVEIQPGGVSAPCSVDLNFSATRASRG